MKCVFITIVFALFSIVSFSQTSDYPPNPEAGKCYVRCRDNGVFTKWEEINCDYIVFSKDKDKLQNLQIKLSNLGYDVDVTKENDLKTVNAYKQYKKDNKKRLRKLKRRNKN